MVPPIGKVHASHRTTKKKTILLYPLVSSTTLAARVYPQVVQSAHLRFVPLRRGYRRPLQLGNTASVKKKDETDELR